VVTDDPFKDRVPAWSPDGRRIAFSSDRSGRLQIWTVLPDGSGPRQMTDLDSGVSGGAWSPAGGRYAFRTPGQPGVPGQLFLADTADSRPPKRPEVLPVVSPTGGSFFPMSWSSDGRSLTVSQRDTDGAMMSGIFVYDFDSQQLRKITDFGNFANWLGDDRRLLFSGRGNLYLTDVRSLLVREILSLPPNMITSPTISGDNRLIAFEMSVTEADVWLATIK
jgi:Tol biopolymer transport system component